MKQFYLLLSFVLLFILWASTSLISSAKERVSQLVHDQRLEAALPLLEQQYARSGSQPLHLAQARLANGDIRGGLSLLTENFMKGEGQFKKATALRASFDLEGYRRTLSERSDASSLRELVFSAALIGSQDKELEALRMLSATKHATSYELTRLAALELAQYDQDRAYSALEIARSRAQHGEKPQIFLLQLKMLLKDSRKLDSDIQKLIDDHLNESNREQALPPVLWELLRNGRPQLVLSLVSGTLSQDSLFEPFVAAKRMLHQENDLIDIFLAQDLMGLSQSRVKVFTSLAPGSSRALTAILEAQIEKRISLSDQELIALAYASMEQTPVMVDEAEAILLHVAQGKLASDRSVDALMYLWGPRPKSSAVDWLFTRASASPGQSVGWLKRLLDCHQYDRATAIIESYGYRSILGLGRMLSERLAHLKTTSQKQSVLKLILANELDSTILLDSAKKAKGLSLNELSLALIGRSIELNPASAQAWAFQVILTAQLNKEDSTALSMQRLKLIDPNLKSLSFQDQAEVQYYQGVYLEKAGDLEAAKRSYSEALDSLKKLGSDSDLSLQAEIVAKLSGPKEGAHLLLDSKQKRALTPGEEVLLLRFLIDAGDAIGAEKQLLLPERGDR